MDLTVYAQMTWQLSSEMALDCTMPQEKNKAVILSAAKDLRSAQGEILRCAQDDNVRSDHTATVQWNSPVLNHALYVIKTIVAYCADVELEYIIRTRIPLKRKGEMMFIHIAIHRPKPGKEQFLIDSMHRFGAAMQGQPGLQQTQALKDRKTGALIGLAVWDSEEALLAARPLMAEAIKDDKFEEWEDEPPEVFLLDVV